MYKDGGKDAIPLPIPTAIKSARGIQSLRAGRPRGGADRLNVTFVSERKPEMLVGSLLLGLLLVGATSALELLSLSESAKVLLLGVVLVGVAIWSRRYLYRRSS